MLLLAMPQGLGLGACLQPVRPARQPPLAVRAGPDREIRARDRALLRQMLLCCMRLAGPLDQQEGGRIIIPAGALDDEPDIRPDHRIFCADQAAWSKDPESVPRYEQAGTPS